MSISRSIVRPLQKSVTRSVVQGAVTDPLQEIIQQLFGNGEQGAFYLPQPVVNGQQVLFQDAAGTIPVTADGDPVGLMKDLSGNGNDATQASGTSQPVYHTDGALHWLEFDGEDDTLIAEAEYSQNMTIAASTINPPNDYGTPSSVVGLVDPQKTTGFIGVYGRRGSTSVSDNTGVVLVGDLTNNIIEDAATLNRFSILSVSEGVVRFETSGGTDSSVPSNAGETATALSIGSLGDLSPAYFSGGIAGVVVVNSLVGGGSKEALSVFLNSSVAGGAQ